MKKLNSIVLIGPTATESEHKLLTQEAGNMEVARMKEALEATIDQHYSKKEYDTSHLTSLQNYEADAFPMLQQRGVKLDIEIFNHKMDQVIEAYRKAEDSDEVGRQERRKLAVNQKHPESGTIHPTYSTSSSRTGRINISKPAIQGWKSSVRAAILPSSPGYNQVYSLDFKAYDPTVLAVLSGDSNLEQDIQSGDLYTCLLKAIGITDVERYRRALKKSFLSIFINGGNPEYFLKKYGLPVSQQDWSKVSQRYDTAQAYINRLNDIGNATSLNGITYQFRSDDDAKFSKFVQHEAAYIFRNVFAEVLKNETQLEMLTLLPVHDEILIAVKDPASVSLIQNVMMDTFKEVTGSSLARVEAVKMGGEGHA